MSHKSITNKEELLTEVMQKILPSTKQVYFLVWFFYFSGFKQLRDWLKDKNIKILVGMDMWNDIKDVLEKTQNISFGVNKEKDSYLNSLVEVFNKTDIYDNEENLEIIKLFINKIIDGSMQIRKTAEDVHSKIYLFEHEEQYTQWWMLPWTTIKWSSNFSYSGLKWRYEDNTIFWDKEEFEAKKRDFEKLRNEWVEITKWWENDEFVKIIKTQTWLKTPEPYYCYIRLLHEYFQNNMPIIWPNQITWWLYQDLQYQTEAIKRWLSVLWEHGWVIIADVVWLGKSIIWSTMLYNIWEKAIIISPPHLVDQRNDYRQMFMPNINVEIFSSGMLKDAKIYDDKDIVKAWVILVDEAHKYRNADTIDYGYLHQLCQWKKVILLTATPFNNQPDDIFNLIKLFQIPTNPTIHTKNWLIADFRNLQNKYLEIRKENKNSDKNKESIDKNVWDIATEIKELIWPVVVRRSRIDLEQIQEYKEDLKNQWYELNQVLDPKEINFELWNIEDLYISTIDSLVETDDKNNPANFLGARYKILTYINNPEKYIEQIEDTLGYNYELLEWRQKNMPYFIRRLLVSRFESSIFAFKKTLNSIIKSIEKVENYIKKFDAMPVIKKWWLPDIEDIFENYEEFEEEEKIYTNLENFVNQRDWFLIPTKDIQNSFFVDLQKDKDFLINLQNQRSNINYDPKLDALMSQINFLLSQNKDKKIVIFSQYADTVNYLSEHISSKFRVLQVTGKHKTKTLKDDIKYNFDAGIEKKKQKNDFDVLIWTDAISEWYNLHRAGIIVNYDIPYNPTKVIQRIWRINRINKKVFDYLEIYNSFPTLIWEKHTNIRSLSTLKNKMIAIVLGIDVKTLSEDEPLSSFYKKVINDDGDSNEQSRDNKYLNEYKNIIRKNPEILEKISKISLRSRLQRDNKSKKWILLFAKKKSNMMFYHLDEQEPENQTITLQEAFELFKADINEKANEVSEKFWDKYNKLKDEIQKPSIITPLNTQTKKSLDRSKVLKGKTNDPYCDLLIEVIQLGSLADGYMRTLRKMTDQNDKEQFEIFKKTVPYSYLEEIIKSSKKFDEQSQELIIIEEFL